LRPGSPTMGRASVGTGGRGSCFGGDADSDEPVFSVRFEIEFFSLLRGLRFHNSCDDFGVEGSTHWLGSGHAPGPEVYMGAL
jgi:hypothetical protein